MVGRAESRGDPKATKPSEVKRILRLANATKKDIFYDLGCGHGRVCIIAAEKVKHTVGIEDHLDTYRKALAEVRKSKVRHKVTIRNSDIHKARISDATIVYSTLNEEFMDTIHYEQVLKRGCRFVCYGVPLIGVKPDKRDGHFYLMNMPFKHAKDEKDWARAVLGSQNGNPARLYKRYRKWYGRQFVRSLRRILARRIKHWEKS